jgi:hypothetical protein
MNGSALGLHAAWAAAGEPLHRGDLLVCRPSGAVYAVTSVDGLCTVRPCSLKAPGPDLSLRLVTRQALKLPPEAPLGDETVRDAWHRLTATDAEAAIQWLRERQPSPATAPWPPEAMAAALSLGERRRVATLLAQTWLRLRPATPACEPWLLAIGRAVWLAFVGELAARVYERPESSMVTPLGSARIVERWVRRRLLAGDLPRGAPHLTVADVAFMWACIEPLLPPTPPYRPPWVLMALMIAERVTWLHRHALRAELGADTSANVLRPDLQTIRICAHAPQQWVCAMAGVPKQLVMRTPGGWRSGSEDGQCWSGLDLSFDDLIRYLAERWIRNWTCSGTWVAHPRLAHPHLHVFQWHALGDGLGIDDGTLEPVLRARMLEAGVASDG